MEEDSIDLIPAVAEIELGFINTIEVLRGEDVELCFIEVLAGVEVVHFGLIEVSAGAEVVEVWLIEVVEPPIFLLAS